MAKKRQKKRRGGAGSEVRDEAQEPKKALAPERPYRVRAPQSWRRRLERERRALRREEERLKAKRAALESTVVEAHRGGQSLAQIAEALGWSRQYVHRLIGQGPS